MLAEESDLISFLANLEFAALPEDVVRDASLRLLDQAGIILAGTQELPARLAIDYAVRRRGSPESLILGTSERVDAEHAAFANGVSGHVLELDDGNRFAMGHPGVVVVPVVLALGEAIHATGQDAVAAIVAGYEMFVRLGSAMNPSHYNRGFHTTGTIGTLAATAAAARLLRFDTALFGSALGLAGSQAGGLFEFLENGTMSKQLHAGVAAGAAIRSVRLAQAGFTGPTTVLQGKNGFMRAMADDVDAALLNAQLGERWAVQECYVKLHACCRHIHPVVDAISEIVAAHHLTPDQVEAVEVATYKFAAKLDNTDVDTDLAAKLSIPFSVAATLLEGQCGLAQFRPELFHDERIEALMARVSVSLDSELDAMVPKLRGCRVNIVTKSGEYKAEALLPRGEPETPVGSDEIERKYHNLVSSILPPETASSYLNRLLNVSAVEDMAILSAEIGAPLTRFHPPRATASSVNA